MLLAFIYMIFYLFIVESHHWSFEQIIEIRVIKHKLNYFINWYLFEFEYQFF